MSAHRATPALHGAHVAPAVVGKVLLSLAAVGTAGAVAASGSLAQFSSSASRGHTVATGIPQLVLGATGAATNRLGIDAVGIGPGDTIYRAFDVTNTGTYTFSSYALSSVATTSSLLDTDTSKGLSMMLERCSTVWVESGTSPAFSYTCGGTRSTVLTSRPVIFTAAALSSMASATPSGTDHLLLTETLPAVADNTFQNLMSSITFTLQAS